MTGGEKYLLSLAIGLGFCSAANAVVNDADNPYRAITVRNVFALKDAPQAQTNEPPPPPPSNLKLAGITDILGRKLALLVLNDAPRPGQPVAQSQYPMLAEGETQGQIKVLEIDQKAGIVKLLNAGVSQSLSFEKDGVKPPSGPAPGATPVAGALPVLPGQPPPNAIPGGSLATPQQQQPGGGGSGVTSIGGAQGATTAYSSLKEIPARPVRTPTAGTGTQPQGLPHNMTADEQKIIMEAQRQLLLDSGRGTEANMIPPTNLRPPPQPQ